MDSGAAHAMLSHIKRFFEDQIGNPARASDPQEHEHALRLATAALLIEISRADTKITEHERSAIVSAVRRVFDLNENETRELIRLAEMEVEEAVSLYQFTQLVDTQFGAADKKHVVELLWQISLADGEVDKYEEHLIRRIADLLHVSHGDFIHAKHTAQQSNG